MSTTLQYAKELLKLQYSQCFEIVQDDLFHKNYALEKWVHSWQVAGAGNYITKRIGWLKEKSPAYIDMVKTAILLHDCCRFTEIAQHFLKHEPCDHGVAAAMLLRNTPMFNDIRIWLPIKHHGHTIDKLYQDEEYQNIQDEKLKHEVELICFLVRDADKIANLYLLKTNPDILPLFLGKANFVPEIDGIISDKIKAAAKFKTTLPRSHDCTIAERMAGFISWFLDINYQSSIDYCQKLGIIDAMFAMFATYCIDDDFKQSYIDFVKNHLQNHVFLR